MKRKMGFLLPFLVVLVMSFCLTPAFAQQDELIRSEVIKAEPVNAVRYLDGLTDYIWEILGRVKDTGKPTFLIADPIQVGLEVAFIEGFLDVERLDLVGGWTFENEEASEFFWGVQYEMAFAKGGIFKRLLPSVYNHRGGIVFGVGFELRG